MFNMLRMDLKRLQKSKSSYVIFILSIFLLFIFFVAMYIALNPDLQSWMKARGFIFQMDGMDSTQTLSFIDLFHLTYTQNFIAILIGIVVVLFNCHENECGFSKNILSTHVNRFYYVVSKIIALSLYALLLILVCCGELVLLNICVSSFFIWNTISEIFLYIALLWFIAIAYVCMYTTLTEWLKSKSGCIGTVIVYATGLWMAIASPLLNFVGWQKILDYTLMSHLGLLSRQVQNIDINVILLMLVNVLIFIFLYILLSTLKLNRKDI